MSDKAILAAQIGSHRVGANSLTAVLYPKPRAASPETNFCAQRRPGSFALPHTLRHTRPLHVTASLLFSSLNYEAQLLFGLWDKSRITSVYIKMKGKARF